MSRKRKMTATEKASARWEDAPQPDTSSESKDAAIEERPVGGDHFLLSVVLMGIVAIVAVVLSVMQGGYI